MTNRLTRPFCSVQTLVYLSHCAVATPIIIHDYYLPIERNRLRNMRLFEMKIPHSNYNFYCCLVWCARPRIHCKIKKKKIITTKIAGNSSLTNECRNWFDVALTDMCMCAVLSFHRRSSMGRWHLSLKRSIWIKPEPKKSNNKIAKPSQTCSRDCLIRWRIHGI